MGLKGITTLCYVFNEDFNVFYDWNRKLVRRDKIESYINMLYNVNYDQKILRILTELVDLNQYTRISLERLTSLLYQKSY